MFSLLERQDNNASDDPDNIVILRHDFQNDKFTRMNSETSVGRDECAAVVVNNTNNNSDDIQHPQRQKQSNQILVFGGYNPNTDVVESCGIVNNSNKKQHQQQQWRQLDRRMPMALYGLAAVTLKDNNHNDKVYLLGGWNYNDGEEQNCCYKYDITTDTYEIMPSMKTNRYCLASLNIKNKYLFAIGGCDDRGDELDTVETFDATSDNNNAEWRILKAKMNKKRSGCCSASVGDIFYVIGGRDGHKKELKSIEFYDTSKENSKFILLDAKMKTARNGASVVVLGCYIIIIGGKGENNKLLNSIEIFNTKTQEFVDSSKHAFPTMTISRNYFAAVLLNNNNDHNSNDTLGMVTNSKKIVVVGGCTGFGEEGSRTAEVIRRFLGEEGSRTAEVIDIKTTAIPISKFCFTKSSNDEYDDGKLPPDINENILSFLISEPANKK